MSYRLVRGIAAGCSIVLVAGLGACGGDSEPESDASTSSSAVAVSKDDEIAALVPEAIASDGVLTIGTDASYAPNEFIDADGETVIGFDADLAKAVGQVLGLQVDLQNA